MKREKKHPLILALQRAQIALHEAALAVGNILSREDSINLMVKDLRDENEELQKEIFSLKKREKQYTEITKSREFPTVQLPEGFEP